MKYKRHFTEEGKNAFDYFEWNRSDTNITDDSGKIIFKQKNVEFPKPWSPLARKIVASKYFYGCLGSPERENSAKSLIGRVSEKITDWAKKDNYFSSQEEYKAFKEELKYITTNQMMAFNSPVWFNVGLDKLQKIKTKRKEQKEAYIIENGEIKKIPLGKEKEFPQTSACFIQKVEDNMESILELAKKEGLLFKHGSGTGTNLSPLRSSKERLSGGGKPSGPLAYWSFYDKVAEIVKSGGKTRRAAKMEILNVWHPDIFEFIESKIIENEKMKILIKAGYTTKEAQKSVNYQNTNISVRINDEFMKAVNEDKDWQTIPVHNKELKNDMPKYKAKELFRKIAEAAHYCGDPGVQFHDTINKWHTCPNSGEINASNPCSEYMFIDDSSCNLASLNLLKFVNGDDTFNIEDFERTIETTAIAQDLEIDNSSYPTKEIAENSHRFRPLGMGYANLGSLLMYMGMPYDSEEARATAATLTSLLTGKVYEISAEMAKEFGSFKEFEKNREPMLKVIKMHKKALDKIDKKKLPKGLEKVLERSYEVWNNVLEKGEKYGFRNAQATVLAPTGTIGFMMDCATKGGEPEIGLVQTKLLSDGGNLKIINETVEPALEKLGYNEKQIRKIKEYVMENEMMEGAPEIKEEHLPIFDCANKPGHGKRTIFPEGHINMMANIQPFLSGAISKTVNFPKETTVENIEKTYFNAWESGVKSVAIYVDGSKDAQPLSFSKEGDLGKRLKPVRRKLPVTANSTRHKFNISGHEGYLHIGLFEEGCPGELFINMSKEGSTVGGLMDTIGILTSIALQYGVPLKDLYKKFRNQKFEPNGMVYEGHKDIHTTTSIIDYIYNFMGHEFLDEPLENNNSKEKMEKQKKIKRNNENNEDNPLEKGGFCAICGERMIKKGNCLEVCINPDCKWQDPKGCGQ